LVLLLNRLQSDRKAGIAARAFWETCFFRKRDGFQMAAGWMRAGHLDPAGV
jgi:hypothetical protein